MIVETTQEKAAAAAASKTYINLEQQHHHQYLSGVMDVKTTKNAGAAAIPRKSGGGVPFSAEAKKVEYRRSGPGKRMFSMSYFSLESFLLLVCLTASLLLLPLILPPLPPPPLMLLLVPICILVVLMVLALTPSKVRDMTYTYV